MTRYPSPIKMRPDTKIDITATIQFRDMTTLSRICKTGIPDVINDEMRDGLQTLVCSCLNQYRSIWSQYEDRGANKN